MIKVNIPNFEFLFVVVFYVTLQKNQILVKDEGVINFRENK